MNNWCMGLTALGFVGAACWEFLAGNPRTGLAFLFYASAVATMYWCRFT